MQYDFRPLISNIHHFAKAGGITIRKYQTPAVDAIVDSVLHHKGLRFVVMFPRQTGKNEIQAQIENYLLFRFCKKGGQIVKVSPTWKPQSINAKQRFERVMKQNQITTGMAKPSQGFQFVMENAKIIFLSGDPNSSIVGATADLLLEVDEAQDVGTGKFDRDIAPMAASTNATTVFFGTAWTSDTLLARERAFAEQKQKKDGIRRVFRLTCEDVFPEVPAYKTYVEDQVAKMGRTHPTIKTQYFSEEIDAEATFIKNAEVLMAGTHSRREAPEENEIIAMMVDVAGGEEENKAGLKLETNDTEQRDATAITICSIDLSTLSSEKHGVTWKVLCRFNWTGIPFDQQYARVEGVINLWNPAIVCCDGTGIGAGMATYIRALVGPERFINFVFTLESKSKMGWDWLGMVNTGRWKEYRDSDELQKVYFEQLKYCRYEVIPGPGQKIKYSVPDGTRNKKGEYIHDDLIMSAAMSAVIEKQIGDSWVMPAETLVVQAADPLDGYDSGFGNERIGRTKWY